MHSPQRRKSQSSVLRQSWDFPRRLHRRGLHRCLRERVGTGAGIGLTGIGIGAGTGAGVGAGTGADVANPWLFLDFLIPLLLGWARTSETPVRARTATRAHLKT
jgi:hypothetical protein